VIFYTVQSFRVVLFKSDLAIMLILINLASLSTLIHRTYTKTAMRKLSDKFGFGLIHRFFASCTRVPQMHGFSCGRLSPMLMRC
jgi:hypothetical protein